VAVMSASPGRRGAVRGQRALRQILDATGARVLSEPEVLVPQAAGRFDATGELRGEDTLEQIRALIEALVIRAHQVQPGTAVAGASG